MNDTHETVFHAWKPKIETLIREKKNVSFYYQTPSITN